MADYNHLTHFDAPFRETPRISAQTLYGQKLEILAYIPAADSV